ncbi:unnamed protein product [Candidula unifasciata]|uniref:Amino acid transporter n=1 Tax=Candidula unifasciata TaxID=100452 RepID=A0A8S3ZWR5_9EUPU|nr:unnamed protein product [Candidula unifasciata]
MSTIIKINHKTSRMDTEKYSSLHELDYSVKKEEPDSDKETIFQETTLKRHLTLFSVVVMLVSVTGHIAVFITPGSILHMSGSVVTTLVILCVGSLLVYTQALCFTEMGCMFQSAGGAYLYLTLTFGNMYGFLVVWGYIILISGPFIALASQIAALYVIKAVTSNSSCNLWWHEVAVHLLAGWLLLTLAVFNCFFLRVLVRMQSFFTACKMLAIGIIIVGGIYFSLTDSALNITEPLEGSHFEPGRISLAILYVIFSTGGWQSVTTLTEEVKNPARILPLAVHITFAVVVFLFLLTYTSYMVVLEKQDIIEAKALALMFCQHLWSPLVPVMLILVALTCVGTLSTTIMGHSRMLFAAARKGDMPSLLCTVHPTKRTPVMAICAVILNGFIMMYSGGMVKLMQFIGLYSMIMGLKVVVALLYLRLTKPQLPRPYKVPLFVPVLQVFTTMGLLCLIIFQEPRWMSVGVLISLSGIPVYLVGVRWRNKPKSYIRFIGYLTACIQKLLNLVPC